MTHLWVAPVESQTTRIGYTRSRSPHVHAGPDTYEYELFAQVRELEIITPRAPLRSWELLVISLHLRTRAALRSGIPRIRSLRTHGLPHKSLTVEAAAPVLERLGPNTRPKGRARPLSAGSIPTTSARVAATPAFRGRPTHKQSPPDRPECPVFEIFSPEEPRGPTPQEASSIPEVKRQCIRAPRVKGNRRCTQATGPARSCS